jgi:tetratricopeptide (TPR) repeat protein
MKSLRKEKKLYAEQAMNAAESLLRKVDGDPHVEPKDDSYRQRAVDAVLSDIDNYQKADSILSPKVGVDKKHRLIVTISAVAAAALITLILGIQFNSKTNEQRPVPIAKHPTENPVEVLLASGEEADSIVVGEKLKEGSMVSVGRGHVALGLSNRGMMWLSSQTQLSLVKIDNSAFEIFLKRGELVASIVSRGELPKIIVDTPSGRVIVTGTSFSVRVSEESSFVSVSRGSVAVESESLGRFPVGESETACLDTGEISTIAEYEREKIGKIARSLGKLSTSDEAVIEIQSIPPGASVLLDNEDLGTTPMIVATRPGYRLLELVLDGYASVREQLTLGSRDKVSRRYEMEVSPTAALPVETESALKKQQAKSSIGSYFISAKEMLENAQSHRKDRNWQGAAEAYEQLIDKFPTSAEARTARVPLGMIELNHLGSPEQALACFEKYLDTPLSGALAQEAAYGRIKALRALGRTEEEMRFIKTFLVEYPLSLRIPELLRRLEALKGKNAKEDVSVSQGKETLKE